MNTAQLRIKKIVLCGLFAALLTGGKLAMMSLPNIEVVTLFIILFSYAFGLKMSLAATLVFCLVEGMLFGFNTWLVAYFIHWPLLAIIISVFHKLGYRKNIVFILIGIVMTSLFGVLTSFIDTLFAWGKSGVNFFTLFFAIYARGAVFYATHIVSNAIFLFIAFPVLKPLFIKSRNLYFQPH